MKYSLVYLMALALSGAAAQSLKDDIHDIVALLPKDKIKEITQNALINDPDVQEAVNYLQSDGFSQIFKAVEGLSEAKDILNYLEDSGLRAYDFLNKINDILDIPHLTKSGVTKRSTTKATGGIAGLIADVQAVVPIEDIKALYKYKLEHSSPFADLVKRLTSQEFQSLIAALLARQEVFVLKDSLKQHGIDLESIVELLNNIIGLQFPIPAIR